jgi:hypothetical protein
MARWRIWPVVALVLAAALSLATWPAKLPARPLLTGGQIDGGTLAILERSCADCHSENTRYPWYSYVAPVSLLIRRDVSDGRRHLNLSRWDEYPLVRKERCLSEIANQVRDGGMPMSIYTMIHRGAVLSEADKAAIFQWTQKERLRLIQQSTR